MEKQFVINGEWEKIFAGIVCHLDSDRLHQSRNLDILYLTDYRVAIRGGGKRYFKIVGKNNDEILKAINTLKDITDLEISELIISDYKNG